MSAHCSYCDEDEDIAHMLYNCKSINGIWSCVGNFYRCTIEIDDVIWGTKDIQLNWVVSQVAFSVYKFWLLKTKNTSEHRPQSARQQVIEDLYFKGHVWKKLNWTSISDTFMKLGEHIATSNALKT